MFFRECHTCQTSRLDCISCALAVQLSPAAPANALPAPCSPDDPATNAEWMRHPAYNQSGIFLTPKILYLSRTDTRGGLCMVDSWLAPACRSVQSHQYIPGSVAALYCLPQAGCLQPAPGPARRETQSFQWCGLARRWFGWGWLLASAGHRRWEHLLKPMVQCLVTHLLHAFFCTRCSGLCRPSPNCPAAHHLPGYVLCMSGRRSVSNGRIQVFHQHILPQPLSSHHRMCIIIIPGYRWMRWQPPIPPAHHAHHTLSPFIFIPVFPLLSLALSLWSAAVYVTPCHHVTVSPTDAHHQSRLLLFAALVCRGSRVLPAQDFQHSTPVVPATYMCTKCLHCVENSMAGGCWLLLMKPVCTAADSHCCACMQDSG